MGLRQIEPYRGSTMARSAKTRTDKVSDATPPRDGETIPDAEVIAETPPAAPEPEQAGPERADTVTDEVDAARDAGAAEETAVDALDDRASAQTDIAPEPQPEAEPAREPSSRREEPVPPAPPPPSVTVQKVGFVPLVLGGVVAAGLGFAAGWQGFLPAPGDAETEAALAAQSARIDEVVDAVAAMPALPDLAPLEAEVTALRADLGPLAERIAALEERVTAMERAPANDGTLSANAIAAWQQDIEDLKAAVATQAAQAGEIAALQSQMAAQEAEMARMVDEAAQRLDAAQSTVAEIEEAATANATATLRRAVLASLQTAVDAGQPFGNLLGELAGTGVDVPEGLSAGAEGVATLAALTDAFPEAARAALAAARAEGLAEDGGNGVMAFLRSQLDVRSVEPREGSDPDAVLSRAEAALRDARLGDALAEIATLPEPVRAPMSDWIAAAEMRVAALTALQALAETLPVPETSN
jgi:hypothetical protein